MSDTIYGVTAGKVGLRIELIPVAGDPLAAVREVAGELRDAPVEEIRDGIDEAARADAQETDFLLALARDSDWLQRSAAEALDEYEVEISAFSYLELILAQERYKFDYVLLELVPVQNEEEKQIVLKAVNYYDEGMTPFDAFQAATAETRGMAVLSSEKNYEDIEVERVPFDPSDEE